MPVVSHYFTYTTKCSNALAKGMKKILYGEGSELRRVLAPKDTHNALLVRECLSALLGYTLYLRLFHYCVMSHLRYGDMKGNIKV